MRAPRSQVGFFLFLILGLVALTGPRVEAADELAALNVQVEELTRDGRVQEAYPIARRAVTMAELRGLDNPDLVVPLCNLAAVFYKENKWAEAARLFERAVALSEHFLGPNHSLTLKCLDGLASTYSGQGRSADAERIYKRVLLIRETTLPAYHRDLAKVLSSLAGLCKRQRRFAEAEAYYKRLLPIEEKTAKPEMFAITLQSYAELYINQARYAEAEPHLKRALSLVEGKPEVSQGHVSNALQSLAMCYRNQRRFPEAERLLKRALSAEEKAYGLYDARLARLVTSLGHIYSDQGRFAEAEREAKRSLLILERAFGPNDPNLGNALADLGGLYKIMGFYRTPTHYAAAEPYLKRALSIFQNWYGWDHPFTTTKVYELVEVYFLQERWAEAVEVFRHATEAQVGRVRHAGEAIGKAPIASTARETIDPVFIQAAFRLSVSQPEFARGLEQEMFQTAQWMRQGQTASSLAQMAARHATGKSRLSQLVRERQDLVSEWRNLDKQLLFSSEPPDRRDAATDQARRARMIAVDERLQTIDATFAKDFREYAALVSPEPLSIAAVQSQLRSDEALILLVDTFGHYRIPTETFAWVVTKTNSRWVRATLDVKAIGDHVAALRCGLDPDAWLGSQCAGLLKTTYTPADRRAAKPMPFDLARAYSLYRALFGQVSDLIGDKHLFVVPSSSLASLPFHVLVTAQPNSGTNYAKAAWIVRRQPVTVLPSVASLEALRKYAKQSIAKRPYFGIGNPLLEGDPNNSQHAKLANEARDRRDCSTKSRAQVGLNAREPRAAVRVRRSDTQPGEIKSLLPLPDSADELCTVARSLGLADSEIRLGAQATETELKALSASGKLAEYRVIHFATHGALSGEITGGADPGLILTPPATATEVDNGYLALTEISELRLDADWVILSACNTAGPEEKGAEALSGLARAFFYAGARAVLVSYWAVDSAATQLLITQAFDEAKREPKIGRSQALRRSMLALLGSEDPLAAHPTYWAPFVVIGEGAR
jgi:CHAT domain-containing protein/tetratricopeptide (TPR) repeat protein